MDIEEAIKKLNKFNEYENAVVLTEEALYEIQEAIETILKELENSIPKERIERYLKEEQERFEVYKRESKTYVKNSENITAEMNNDINKLLSEISKKDKMIDLMAEHIVSSAIVEVRR